MNLEDFIPLRDIESLEKMKGDVQRTLNPEWHDRMKVRDVVGREVYRVYLKLVTARIEELRQEEGFVPLGYKR